MIFDTHAHYDDEQFNEDRVELLNSMEEQGVGTIVNVSAAYNSCRKVIALAKEYPFVYAAVGIHPDEVGSLNEETFAQMKELFKEEKVVAVGEIGLDYYWDNEPREVQKKWFIRQLELARELDLPVLIHSREAAADTMEIMKEHAKGLSGVIHCYSYSKEMAQEFRNVLDKCCNESANLSICITYGFTNISCSFIFANFVVPLSSEYMTEKSFRNLFLKLIIRLL